MAKRAASKSITKRKPAKNPPRKTKKRVQAVPDKYPAVGAYLRIKGAAGAIAWYMKVFGAKPRMRMDMPDGRVGHAELAIGKGLIMLADEFPEMNILGPKTLGGSSVTLHHYVRDVDAVISGAVKQGAKILRPISNEFYGDRAGTIEDPFGHVWMVQTHIEDVSAKEMKKRLNAMVAG